MYHASPTHTNPCPISQKWLCDPHRLNKDDCLIYSVGSNGQFTFEAALNEVAPKCEVHVFDPYDYEKHAAKYNCNDNTATRQARAKSRRRIWRGPERGVSAIVGRFGLVKVCFNLL